jgi:pyruvate dehydrogenase E1 component alpha subunit
MIGTQLTHLQGTFEVYKCEMPPQHAETTREELLSLYRTMVRIRKMELTADNLYKQKLIRGFCHLYNGQVCYMFGLTLKYT